MKGILQAMAFFYFGLTMLDAAEALKPFGWEMPKITKSLFSNDLGMLDPEREEYATNLAHFAASQITSSKATATSLTEGRRVLALALHLSPRNKRALVVNFQLSKNILPEVVQGSYSPQVLARLLLTRGELLEKQGGTENKQLARYFIRLAASMDPKNEDAVYASEIQRLDHGDVDWAIITDPVHPARPTPVNSPAKPTAPKEK